MAKLEAPPSYWNLTPSQKDELCNGCGPGEWGSRIVPDNWWFLGVNFAEACNIHDWNYRIGVPKELADKMFLHNMLTLADEAFWGCKWIASRIAFMYFLAVKHGGAGAYNKKRSQN